MSDAQFTLYWHNHERTLISFFGTLLDKGTLVDCTLAAEGQYLKAHRVVLAASSPYFEVLLNQHYEQHPIIILEDIKFTVLKHITNFIYRGNVTVSQNELESFVTTAIALQIKGLLNKRNDAGDVGANLHGDASGVSSEGSVSPSPQRKRKRTQSFPQENGRDFDTTNNPCDLPNQTHLQVPTSIPVKNDLTQNKQVKEKEILQPPPENNWNSMTQDFIIIDTLENDIDLYIPFDASVPGPSHVGMSSEGYRPRMTDGDQSTTDEFLMATQDTLGSVSQEDK